MQLSRNCLAKSLILIGLWSIFSLACTSNQQTKTPSIEASVEPAKDSCGNWLANFLQDSLFSSPLAEFEYFPDHNTYFLKKIRTPKGFFGITANPPFFLATYEGDT